MQLGTANTVLMVIDMQNGFCRDDGSMAKLGFDVARLAAAIPGCKRLVAAARQADIPIVYTRYVYRPGLEDGGVVAREIFPAMKDVGLCVEGTPDANIIDELAPQAGDTIINKNRPSAFYSTGLESYLRSTRVENIVMCGVTTNICVETTARDASQRDYRTFVVSDAVGEVEQDRHDAALKSLGYLFARVMTTDDVFESWKVPLNDVA